MNTARQSRTRTARSVWSAWSLLPLSNHPCPYNSASKLDALPNASRASSTTKNLALASTSNIASAVISLSPQNCVHLWLNWSRSFHGTAAGAIERQQLAVRSASSRWPAGWARAMACSAVVTACREAVPPRHTRGQRAHHHRLLIRRRLHSPLRQPNRLRCPIPQPGVRGRRQDPRQVIGRLHVTGP